MAVMPEADRAQCMAQFIRDQKEAMGLTKAELRAALDATDAWIDSNATAFNSALPQPARGTLSATQKTLLFCYVAMRRRGILPTEGGG